jgi:hypothetical protein
MAYYEAQIAELEDKLARVEIVDASKFSGDTILSARSDQFIEPLRASCEARTFPLNCCLEVLPTRIMRLA